VDVHGCRPVTNPLLRGQMTHAAAFLLLHPDSSGRDLDRALWPHQSVPVSVRTQLLDRLRLWFTPQGGARSRLTVRADSYRFDDEVACDWSGFQDLHGQGRGAGPGADLALARALSLARGRPLAGIDPVKYPWAADARRTMTAAVVDVAHTLARRRMEQHDVHSSALAAARGLDADPHSELLLRDLLAVHTATDDASGVRRTVQRIRDIWDAHPTPTEEAADALRQSAATRL